MGNYREVLYFTVLILILLSGCMQIDGTKNPIQDKEEQNTNLNIQANHSIRSDQKNNSWDNKSVNETNWDGIPDLNRNFSENSTQINYSEKQEISDKNSDNNISNINKSNSSLDSDGDGVPDSEDDYPENKRLSKNISYVSQNLTLSKDDYRTWRLNIDNLSTVEYKVQVKSGIKIDIIIIDQEDFDYFREREPGWDPYREFSTFRTVYSDVSFDISKGDYVFILDNTTRATNPYSISGNYRANIEVNLHAYR